MNLIEKTKQPEKLSKKGIIDIENRENNRLRQCNSEEATIIALDQGYARSAFTASPQNTYQILQN